MKVRVVQYNWRMAGSLTDRDGAGEDWNQVIVGINHVISIEENDQWNYLVRFEDGSALRIFNPNAVQYYPDEVAK